MEAKLKVLEEQLVNVRTQLSQLMQAEQQHIGAIATLKELISNDSKGEDDERHPES